MSWYQCSTRGELFPSSADLWDHKRRNHWVPAASARQRLGRRILRAALAATLGAAVGAVTTACENDGPAPAYALECFPSLQPPTVCTDEPRGVEAPPETSTTPTIVLAPPAADAPVEPDPAPVAVSPTPLCVSPSLGPIPCGSQDVCADAFLCPTPQTVAAGEPPVLPVTGGADLALSLIALGFVLVGLTMVRPWWRRGR